jgi:Fe-S-cluster containining protein
VHLKEGEGEAMAAELGISEDEFFEKYTCLGEDRRGLVLIDGADGYCIFLQEDNLCLVQGAKPQQCRDYPYKWRSELLISGCAAEGAVVR